MGFDLDVVRFGASLPGFGSQRAGARGFHEHLRWGEDDDSGRSGNGIVIDCTRPRDFAKATAWVLKHFPEPSEIRDWYMRALDVMERDDAVCIRISR